MKRDVLCAGIVEFRRKAMKRIASVLGIEFDESFGPEELADLLFIISACGSDDCDWTQLRESHGHETRDYLRDEGDE